MGISPVPGCEPGSGTGPGTSAIEGGKVGCGVGGTDGNGSVGEGEPIAGPGAEEPGPTVGAGSGTGWGLGTVDEGGFTGAEAEPGGDIAAGSSRIVCGWGWEGWGEGAAIGIRGVVGLARGGWMGGD